MTDSIATRRYKFTGIDCPSCAARIEQVLRTAEGLENTVVDFAGGVILLDPHREDEARTLIGRTEPGATIIVSGPADRVRRFDFPTRLAGSLFLFAAGLALRLLYTGASGFPGYLEISLFVSAYLLSGWPVILGAFRNLRRGRVIDELFLMTIATAGAIAISELPEAAAVMLFYSVGEYLQGRAVSRSRDSIRSAMSLRVDFARVVDGNLAREADPESVAIGEVLEVRPGEGVPLDGTVVRGETWMDTSALTGESVPRRVSVGDTVSAGYVNDDGVVRLRVDRDFSQSAFSRVKKLLDEASARKSPTEMILSRFAAVYTPIVVGFAAALVLVLPLFFRWSLSEAVYSAMVLLVISCPCALVVSVPLAYFAGIGRASRSRILLRGSDVLDNAGRIGTVVFDKTGTLTAGHFRLQSVNPSGLWTEADLLRTADEALSLSNHPIARSVRESRADAPPVDASDSFREIKGSGVIVEIGNRRVLAGSAAHLEGEGIPVPEFSGSGSVVHIAVDRQYAGYLLLSDSLKNTSAAAVGKLRDQGVKRIAMLTGDRTERAAETAGLLGISEVYSELLPEDKMRILESLLQESPEDEKVAFVGDGLNDAPAILRADIGMAMGGTGTDLAIESADVVFMDDDPEGIPGLIHLARFTRRIVIANIVFALAVKSVFMALGVFADLPMWVAVIGDVGVTLLAVLNSLRILGSNSLYCRS